MFKQQIEVEFYLNACVGVPKNMRMEVWERIAIDEKSKGYKQMSNVYFDFLRDTT